MELAISILEVELFDIQKKIDCFNKNLLAQFEKRDLQYYEMQKFKLEKAIFILRTHT